MLTTTLAAYGQGSYLNLSSVGAATTATTRTISLRLRSQKGAKSKYTHFILDRLGRFQLANAWFHMARRKIASGTSVVILWNYAEISQYEFVFVVGHDSIDDSYVALSINANGAIELIRFYKTSMYENALFSNERAHKSFYIGR